MATCEICNETLGTYESNHINGKVTCDSCFAAQNCEVEEFDCDGVNPAETAKWKSFHDNMRAEEKLATAPDYRFGIFVIFFVVLVMAVGFFFERHSEQARFVFSILFPQFFVSLLFTIHQHIHLRKKFFNDDPTWKRDEAAMPKKISIIMLSLAELSIIVIALQNFSWGGMIGLICISALLVGAIIYLKKDIR